MEIRRRHTREAQHGSFIAPPTAEQPGFWARVADAIIWTVTLVTRVLRSLVYGLEEKEDEVEDTEEYDGKETSTVLGYLDHGRIAVSLQRGKKSKYLSMSCDDGDEVATAALNHAAAAYAFLGTARHARILRCISPGPPIHLANATLGTIRGFLSSTPYPSIHHASIPAAHATLALPLHWLLQTTSALEFLHQQKITHGSLSPSTLLLTPSLNISLTDLTHGTWNGHNNGVPHRSTFGFPAEALRYDYFDGEPSANSQALGLAADIFDFGTLAYELLCREQPTWSLPRGNGTWALEELHEALDARAPELGDEVLVGYVVRDAWCLVYEEGRVLKEDFLHALGRHGVAVDGDEVVGVREFAREGLGGYVGVWEF